MRRRRLRLLAAPLLILLCLVSPEPKTRAMWHDWDPEPARQVAIERLRIVGREGPCPRAAAWMRPALKSHDWLIRTSAAAWYREVDPGWADDPEIREAVLSGIRLGDGK